MDAQAWLGILGFGGLCGVLGQSARICVGFKKLSDTANAQQSRTKDLVDYSRLGVSLLIGFVAGAVASMGIFSVWPKIELAQIMSVAAAGYAGSDFLEGFINRTLGPLDPPAGGGAAGGGDAAGGATTPDGALG